MDTITTITVVSPSKEKANEAIDGGFNEIKRLEHLLNYFSPDSEISAINRSSGIRPVKVSRDTLDIVKTSLEIAKATGGAFNPTIGPVIRLWKFSRQNKEHSIPQAELIKDALRLIDYKKVRINEETSEIYLEVKGMELDLGGIAKGYAADRAIEVIKGMGVKAALVAVAGDIKGFGVRPNGKPWHIGIQDPRPLVDKPESVFATLYLKDMAISTSGDYQRFFIKDGKRYHHIIDPKTGYPAESSIISASVIADSGFMTDGLSTAIFIFPPNKAVALLESLGVEGVIVDRHKRVYITKGLMEKVEIINKGYKIR
jgi:thiamine biosynthesis lipoprotein